MNLIAEKYAVLKELGRGGSGAVYLVEHVDLGVQYALKLLDSSFSENQHFIERFKREAAVLQQFSHPGITQLRDFGRTQDGHYYLAMDFCEGVSLRDMLYKDGPYPLTLALDLLIQILDVLEAAHKEGIIHRDIQPANILIDKAEDGREVVKILDFGTALLKEHLDLTDKDAEVTVGTPCYMSPEQASAVIGVDHRIDIYACGIVLYELLTGEVPFEGENIVQTLVMHLTQTPTPFALTYGMPEYVEEIAFKAIEKKPIDRFATATAFREACEEALGRIRADRIQVRAADPKLRVSGSIQPVEESRPATDSQKIKVLCLDDDEMILNILKHILEADGYEVFVALDCSAIHDHLFNKKVDLLISDVQMPGMSGPKVCQLIKKSVDNLRIIFFSNLPEKDLEKIAIENDANAWISKQTKPEAWLSKIKEVLATTA
ncbi:protein kinase [Oligoflexia bacterium]|nr:protein kinase [Oligoflexia bacterium]